jgi:mRNA interferase RelE/StbE
MYDIKFAPSARRDITRLDRIPMDDFQRIRAAIFDLSNEPRPQGCLKLKGKGNDYRIRVGKYRVIYEIKDKELIVLVIQVSRRNEYTYDF